MRKRFLGIFLAVAMVVTCMPTMAFATEEELAAPVTEETTEAVTEPQEEAVVTEPEAQPVTEEKKKEETKDVTVNFTVNENWDGTTYKTVFSAIEVVSPYAPASEGRLNSGVYVQFSLDGSKWYSSKNLSKESQTLLIDAAGTYTIKYYIYNYGQSGAYKSYNWGSKDAPYTTKVRLGNTAPTAAEKLTYTGKAQSLIAEVGDANWFKFNDKVYAAEDVAKVCATDADDYTVAYSFKTEEPDKGSKTWTKLDTITIHKALLTVKWGDTELTYNGEKQEPEVWLVNKKNGFKVQLKDNQVKGSEKNVGQYTAQLREDKISFDNYRLKEESKDNPYKVSFNIHRKEIKVIADDFEKVYGDVDPEFTAIGQGFVKSEKAEMLSLLAKVVRIDRAEGEDAGDYDLTPRFTENYKSKTVKAALATLKQNYKYEFVDGTLTINKKKVEITVTDAEKTFGYEDPDFEVTQEGVLEDDEELFEALGLKFRRESGEAVAVGEYEINVHVRKDGGEKAAYKKAYKEFSKNYEITKIHDGTLTIKDVQFVAGADQKYVKGTKEGATFKLDGNDEALAKVLVDGVEVDAANYTVTKGSTILNFKQAYLDKLSTGKHTVAALYQVEDETQESGVATTTVAANFTVVASPNTGDTNDMAPFAVLMLIAIIGIAGVSLKRN